MTARKRRAGPRASSQAADGDRDAAPGGECHDTGHRPAYVIEIYISPQMRERDPDRPLSLLEALEVGRPQHQEPACAPNTEPPGTAGATAASKQLPGRDRCAGARPREGLQTAGGELLTGGRERATAVRSVECACTAKPGMPCSPSGDHLARYLRAEQRGAIARQTLRHVIAGLDVIAPHVLIQPPQEKAARNAGARAAGPVVRARPDARKSPDRIEASAEPGANTREAPEPEAGA